MIASVHEEILDRSKDRRSPAILGRDGEGCSYAALRSRVDCLAARLRASGAGAGKRVGISLDPGAGYLTALLGVRMAGATAVLFGTSWTPFEQRRTFLHAMPEWILAAPPPAVDQAAESVQSCDEAETRLYRFRHSGDLPQSEPDDAIIIYTSGTTGAPKGVVLSEAAVSANVRAVAEYLELTERDSTAVFTPTCYAYAASQFLTHALAGAAIFPVPTYLRFPMAVLQACAVHRLTGLAANPTTFRILLGLEVPPEWDLSSVRYLMSGGQFLDARLAARILSRFPEAQIINMYGASENSPRVSYHWIEDRGGDDPARFYPVGLPIRGTRIEIRAEDGRLLPRGEIGEVLVSGTSLMRGY